MDASAKNADSNSASTKALMGLSFVSFGDFEARRFHALVNRGRAASRTPRTLPPAPM
jgi:hypothetical protein